MARGSRGRSVRRRWRDRRGGSTRRAWRSLHGQVLLHRPRTGVHGSAGCEERERPGDRRIRWWRDQWSCGRLGRGRHGDDFSHPGTQLYVAVGGNGADGGWNGGANSSLGFSSNRGGGASDVRTLARSEPTTLLSRLIVAGGGGGAGMTYGVVAGGAGGSAGAAGQPGGGTNGGGPGQAGTQSAGDPAVAQVVPARRQETRGPWGPAAVADTARSRLPSSRLAAAEAAACSAVAVVVAATVLATAEVAVAAAPPTHPAARLALRPPELHRA